MGKKVVNCVLVALCFVAVSNAATNLLTNPGFETGDFNGWAEWGGVEIVTDAYEGMYAASLTDNAGIYQYNIILPAADDYTLAFWYKGDISTSRYYYGIESDGGDIIDGTLSVTSEWTQVVVPFTIDAPTIANLWLWGDDGGATGNVIVDNFQLVRGEIGPVLEAMNPIPKDGQTSAPIDTDLSWTAGDDPAITEVYKFDVYVDPNILKVQARSLNCVYVSLDRGPTETVYDPNPSSYNFDSSTIYYWCVDSLLKLDYYPDPNFVPGSIWRFETMPGWPHANAGGNLLATTEMALEGVQLNGEVTDPDENLVTVLWSVIEKPDGSMLDFMDASDPATIVTVDTEGLYVLNLFAEDIEGHIARDNTEILVYPEACEAAQNNPDGYTSISSDCNLDCENNTEDFASLASEWLKINYLTEYGSYEEDIKIRNLLINPGFETGDPTGWDAWDEGLPYIVAGEQLSGSYCAMADARYGFSQWFHPTPGSTYDFTVNYKGTVKDGNGWWGCYTPDKETAEVFGGTLTGFMEDEYQKITIRKTVPLDWEWPDLHFWVWVMAGAKGTAYYDDFEIIEVSKSVYRDITKAHDPQPANEKEDVPIDNLTLSFNAALDPNTLTPNPNVTAHYLYIGNPGDPNMPETPIEVPVDVDPADGNIDPIASYTIMETLLRNKVYYWRVDERLENDANVITGDLWSFTTETLGPKVDSGLNWVVWLDPADATVQLDATVTDPDDNLSSILWSVVEAPADTTVLFSPNETVEDPIVTVDTVGTYILKISAEDDDGYTDEELMAINVYADVCEATRNHPEHPQLAADFTADCNVNMDDCMVLIEEWMEFNYITEPSVYDNDTHIDINGYMVNGGFETGDPTGWYAAAGRVTTIDPYTGLRAFGMEDVGGIFQDVELTGGDYVLSFWTRGDISTGFFFFGIDGASGGGSFNVTPGWRPLSFPFTVSGDQTISLWFWGGGSNSANGTCVIDDVWILEE